MTTNNAICLSRIEAAHALGIGVSMLKILIARGDVQEIRIGRRSLIPRSEVERYVSERIRR